MGQVKRSYVKVVRLPDGGFTIDLPSVESYQMVVVEFNDEGDLVGYVRPMTNEEMAIQAGKRWAK